MIGVRVEQFYRANTLLKLTPAGRLSSSEAGCVARLDACNGQTVYMAPKPCKVRCDECASEWDESGCANRHANL